MIAAAPTAFGGKERKKADSSLKQNGGRFETGDLRQPVSIAGRSADDDLVTVGVPGRRLRVGKPNSTNVDDRPGKSPNGNARGVRPGDGATKDADDVVAKRTGGRANGVEFVDAFGPGTNLVYDVFTDGVKESIVLNRAPKAAPVFRFPVEVEGLSWRTNKDGAFEFFDNAGTVQFRIPAAFAYDSRGGQDTPGNAYVNVKTELIADAKGLVLVMSPSLAWLTSPQRVYPVVIDPTIQMQPWNPMNLGYMPWGDNSGGTQFSAWTNDMLFGNWWGSNWASYIQFDPNLFSGKLINNATLNLRVQNCDAGVESWRFPVCWPLALPEQVLLICLATCRWRRVVTP